MTKEQLEMLLNNKCSEEEIRAALFLDGDTIERVLDVDYLWLHRVLAKIQDVKDLVYTHEDKDSKYKYNALIKAALVQDKGSKVVDALKVAASYDVYYNRSLEEIYYLMNSVTNAFTKSEASSKLKIISSPVVEEKLEIEDIYRLLDLVHPIDTEECNYAVASFIGSESVIKKRSIEEIEQIVNAMRSKDDNTNLKDLVTALKEEYVQNHFTVEEQLQMVEIYKSRKRWFQTDAQTKIVCNLVVRGFRTPEEIIKMIDEIKETDDKEVVDMKTDYFFADGVQRYKSISNQLGEIKKITRLKDNTDPPLIAIEATREELKYWLNNTEESEINETTVVKQKVKKINEVTIDTKKK